MPLYKNFNIKERKMIESLVKKGMEFKEIAEVMERSASGIRDEVIRNGGFLEYNADLAQELANKKRVQAAKKRGSYNREQNINPYKKHIIPQREERTQLFDKSEDPLIEERQKMAKFVRNLMNSPEMAKFLD